MRVKLILPALTEAKRPSSRAAAASTRSAWINIPHPHAVSGTTLHTRMESAGRMLHRDLDRYDTRHAVFQPARMSGAALALGTPSGRLRHLAYAAGWKKFEPLWDLVIRLKRVSGMLPLLERILDLDGAPSSPRAGWSGAGARPAAAERAASS